MLMAIEALKQHVEWCKREWWRRMWWPGMTWFVPGKREATRAASATSTIAFIHLHNPNEQHHRGANPILVHYLYLTISTVTRTYRWLSGIFTMANWPPHWRRLLVFAPQKFRYLEHRTVESSSRSNFRAPKLWIFGNFNLQNFDSLDSWNS